MNPTSRWQTILATITITYALVIVVWLGVIYTGIYDIAADRPHWGVTFRVFEAARIRSIKARAAAIAPPASSMIQPKSW